MKKIIKWIIIIVLGILLYMRFIATSGLNIKEYSIIDNNLPSSFDGVKIIHLSDIHYGTTVTEKRLESIVNKVNSLNPDMIIFTGDLYDESVLITEDAKNKLISILNKLEAPLGKYAIIGNHDYSSNYFEEIITSSGFTYLKNNSKLVYNNGDIPIELVGYDDATKGNPDYSITLSDNYKITLIHEPDEVDNLTNSNLVFAGHSHGGQVRLPLIGSIFTPVGAKKYTNDYYQVNNMNMYVSYGIGTSILKLRFNDKPSINLYRLYQY